MEELISKSAAVEALKDAMCMTGYQSRAIDAIRQLPTIEAEPVRHGRWIKTDKRFMVHELAEGEIPTILNCSLCGFKHEYKDKYGFSCIWHYCPNCGAKLDGGAQDD